MKKKFKGYCRLCEQAMYQHQVRVRFKHKEFLQPHEDFIIVHKACTKEYMTLLTPEGKPRNQTIDKFWQTPSYETMRNRRLGKIK